MTERSDSMVITVSGLHSGIGKTLLAERIIALTQNAAAIKVSINDQISMVCDDEADIMVAGKDTCRLKNSGAVKVVWIRSSVHDLPAMLADALKRVAEFPRVIIEGNSVLQHLKPDLPIFVCDRRILDNASFKPGRIETLRKAAFVINNITTDAPDTAGNVQEKIRGINPQATVAHLDLGNESTTSAYLKTVLARHGFI